MTGTFLRFEDVRQEVLGIVKGGITGTVSVPYEGKKNAKSPKQRKRYDTLHIDENTI